MAREVTTKEYLSSTATSLTSGAARIGVAAITGLMSNNPGTLQAALVDIISQIAAKVSPSRAIGTSGGLQGGGDLSADRTLSLTDVGSAGSSTLASITVDTKGRVTSHASGSAGAVPDASTTVKGSTKLATAPASPTNPIAAGDNDPRLAVAAAGTASIRAIGSGATDVVAGNDSRLSAGAAGTATVRALGTSSTTAASGDDSRFTKYLPLTFFYAGDVATKTGLGHEIVMVGGTLDVIRVAADSAPAGGTVTITFVKEAGGPGGSATTIGSITLSIASKSGSSTGLSVSLSAGDAVRMDVTTNAGYTAASCKNLTGKARYSY